MKSTVLWALVVLNVVLLVSLIARATGANTAIAQPNGGGVRAPGDYLTIPADVLGTSTGIIVVVEQGSGQLSAVSYDDANKRFDRMPKIDLKQVFRPAPANPGRQGPRG